MALEDFYTECIRCHHCSMCKWVPLSQVKGWDFAYSCPSVSRYIFHTYAAGGRLVTALSLMERRFELSDVVVEKVFRCQMCGACDVSCKMNNDFEPLEIMRELRNRCVEEGALIVEHMAMMDSMKKEDNPLGLPKAERGKWSEGLGLKDVTTQSAEVLFFPGCRFSYDEELWPVVRGAVELLRGAGVDMGIAYKEDGCCGSRAFDTGYLGEALTFAEDVASRIKSAGVKEVVTPCADCYGAFKRFYAQLEHEPAVPVYHITEYLHRLMGEGRIEFSCEVPMTVTYHDPCHLGRLSERNIPLPGREWKERGQLVVHEREKAFGAKGIYEPPRDILKGIPGLDFVEMSRIKEYAWCCGAGGGVYEAFPDFAKWAAAERIREAKDTGAEALVTACPWCERNLKDAVEESGDGPEVLNIIELMLRGIGGK